MANLIGPSGKLYGRTRKIRCHPFRLGAGCEEEYGVRRRVLAVPLFQLYQPDSHRLLGYYFDGKGVWVGGLITKRPVSDGR